MKRILVPIDFSDNAFNALRYAVQFFMDEACTFYLFHTFTPTSYHIQYLIENPMPYGGEAIARMNAEKDLQTTKRTIEKEFPNTNHQFECIAVFDLLVNGIQEMINKHAIELVIMGTKGATGAKEIFLGSNAVHVIKNIQRPIIAVPANFTYERPSEILFMTDYLFDVKNTFLSYIKEFAKHHVSRINMLNINYGDPLSSVQKEAKLFLDTLFKGSAHLFHLAERESITTALNEFQKKHKIHLLVMIRNKHSFFENLFMRPVINTIAYHTVIPFMVIPA